MAEELTRSQVQDVIDFAAGLAYGEGYGVLTIVWCNL